MAANKNNILDGIDLNNPQQTEALAQHFITEIKEKGKSVQEAMNLSADLVEEIYALAYNYYHQGKYNEAVSLFYLLVSMSPKEFKYLLGLAATYHQLKDYHSAAIGFYLAAWQKPEDPYPIYYIADCMLKLNQDKESLPFLKQAIRLSKDKPEYVSLRERCKLIRERIKNNNN